MKIIEYTTPEQQLEKLKSQGLIIKDEKFARDTLALCGYSNLIKSYRDPYFIATNNSVCYRSGVSFEQVYSLYILDRNLRNAVMASMLDLEEHLKEIAANVVAKAFGTHQDKYLLYRNYANKRKHIYRFTLSGILETMRKTLNTDKDPIRHYNIEHGTVPPWILFKSIYFSTIVNFIDQFKKEQIENIAEILYHDNPFHLQTNSLKKLMMDTLYICLEYRNLAAHGGRIYNYVCKNSLRTTEIFATPPSIELSGFSQLLFLLSLLNYKRPFRNLSSVLTEEVNRHCHTYPQDVTYLGQILNINIVPHSIVYISKKSGKFHSNQYCSGMINSESIDLEDAISQGYIPCKRCIKN